MENQPIFSDPIQPGYAGFWRRFAASFIDGIVLWLIQVVLISPLLSRLGIIPVVEPVEINDLSDEEKIRYFFSILPVVKSLLLTMAITGWLYYALLESSIRQSTIGKMAIGLFVTDEEGHRISFARASARYFGKYLSSLTLLIGYIMAGFTAKKQALHDKIAKTLVWKK